MRWVLVLALVAGASADTPANCTYHDVEGTWMFYESERSQEPTIDCSRGAAVVEKVLVHLTYPNTVVDQWGNEGTWTMVYNQGFEVTVLGRSYFAYSDFTQAGEVVTSFCNRTLPGQGWSHDVTVRNWACFSGRKIEKEVLQEPKTHPSGSSLLLERAAGRYIQSEALAAAINRKQSSWVATTYPHLDGLTHGDALKMRGGSKARLHWQPPALKRKSTRAAYRPPASLDWRSKGGVDYVSQVRNQGACGSCYAFSSMGMLEARVRVATNNYRKFTFSTQDIVSCSALAQGCEGGFPYLIAGRYAKDYGVVEEECSPYTGNDTACSTQTCLRHYTESYGYVGGYYGGCSEEAMMKALEDGPLSVSFMVYKDFTMYKSGVYHHVGLQGYANEFEPFELTNHAVLLVGYGTDDKTGEEYWTIKNSWGEDWGEGGFFRIRRGVDECSIESIAVEARVIP